MVFNSLYQNIILEAIGESTLARATQEAVVGSVETSFLKLFEHFSDHHKPSALLRKEQLSSGSGQLCRLRSNRICLFCLFDSAQHTLFCGHTLCDRCAQVFGEPNSGLEFHFTVKECIICLYRRPLIVEVLPPTSSPAILAIDGGGVRGVIPLEFLALVQEHLHPCTIHDVVDLAVGTSAGEFAAKGVPRYAQSGPTYDAMSRWFDFPRPIRHVVERTSVFPDF